MWRWIVILETPMQRRLPWSNKFFQELLAQMFGSSAVAVASWHPHLTPALN
jgi:hypothetical protein